MTHNHSILHNFVHDFDRVFEIEALAGAHIQLQRHGIEAFLADSTPSGHLFHAYPAGQSERSANTVGSAWIGLDTGYDKPAYRSGLAAMVTEVGCMAHARRKFFDLHVANQSPVAAEALRRIAELYEIEGRGRKFDTKQRQQLRAHETAPKLQSLHDWLQSTRQDVANGGSLAKAMDYSLKRWPALSRYALSGDLPIDNNPVENVIRPIAVGKKNWLFTGSERAGRRAAAIQSLLATAKLNGIEPSAWLKDTLEKLPTWPNSRLDELLPLRTATE